MIIDNPKISQIKEFWLHNINTITGFYNVVSKEIVKSKRYVEKRRKRECNDSYQ